MRMPVPLIALVLTAVAADAPVKPITPAEAARRVNEKVTVEMRVQSTGGRTNCYLNSEEDFKDEANFTVFIPKETLDKFKEVKIEDPATYFKDKTIHVTGRVIRVMEKPRIVIQDPAQIKVLEEAKKQEAG